MPGGALKNFLEKAVAEKILSGRDLHVVLEALPTPLSWATLGDGCIRFMNRSFTKTFGYTVNDFQYVLDWINGAYPVEYDRLQANLYWNNLWKADSAGVSEVDMLELRIRCADGSIRTVQHRGILLYELGIGIATFEDITDRKNAEEALRQIAFCDPLTGLANRRAMQAQWQARAASLPPAKPMSAVLLIDLDGFKAINDRLGHDAGDEVLITVSERLRQNVRHSDMVCRVGGDEFVVCLNEVSGAGYVDAICERIVSALRHPVVFDGEQVTVGASIGVSVFPHDSDQLGDLIRCADRALYRLKSATKGGWEWFSPLPA